MSDFGERRGSRSHDVAKLIARQERALAALEVNEYGPSGVRFEQLGWEPAWRELAATALRAYPEKRITPGELLTLDFAVARACFSSISTGELRQTASELPRLRRQSAALAATN